MSNNDVKYILYGSFFSLSPNLIFVFSLLMFFYSRDSFMLRDVELIDLSVPTKFCKRERKRGSAAYFPFT